MRVRRIYEGCPYIMGTWPQERACGRPVKIQRGRPSYCPEHAARLPFWPTGENYTDRPMLLLANPEPQTFAHVERMRP